MNIVQYGGGDKINKIGDQNPIVSNIFNNFLYQPYRNVINTNNTLTISNYLFSVTKSVPNKSTFYIYTFDFYENFVNPLRSKIANQNDILLIDNETNISNYNAKFNSPLTINKSIVKYSISLYLKIDSLSSSWRNILYFGSGSDNIDSTMSDGAPSLTIYPNSTSISFRHSSSLNLNNGCDLLLDKYDKVPELGNWFHLTVTVDDNIISIY